MDLNSFKIYVHNAFPALPWWHWILIVAVALGGALVLKRWKGFSTYATIALAITLFVGLFLLDGIVLNRLNSEKIQSSPIDIRAEFRRLQDCSIGYRVLMLFNVLAFIPFGAALSEFLNSTLSIRPRRCMGFVALTSLGLSLLIECSQFLLKVGLFEITDMVLNMLGAVIGAVLAMSIRKMICR